LTYQTAIFEFLLAGTNSNIKFGYILITNFDALIIICS